VARPFSSLLPSVSSRRSARSIQKILDAAAGLFGTHGFQGASMSAVAKAAGVSKGLVHYHFHSKEHLLIEAELAMFRQIYKRFEDRFQRGEVGLATALEALDALWDGIREMHRWAPFLVETLAVGNHQGALREHLDGFREESLGLLNEGVRRVFEQDLDRLTVPPERIALLIRTTLTGLAVELAHARAAEEREVVDQNYRDFRLFFELGALAGG